MGSALDKQRRDQPLTIREAAALKAYRKIQDDQDRDRLCRELPKSFFLQLANSDTATLTRIATRHRLPLRGDHVDLAAFLSQVITLLADEGHKLLTKLEDSNARKFRRERARIAELKRKRLEDVLLPRSEVHATYREIAALFRSAHTTIAVISAEAADVLDETIDEYIKTHALENDGSSSQQ